VYWVAPTGTCGWVWQAYGLKRDTLDRYLFRDKKDQKDERMRLFWQRIGTGRPHTGARTYCR
jgi:hypothetical protein